MNDDILHELINRYTNDFARINNSAHDEIFKWRAVKHFQDTWFSETAKTMSFPALFSEAKRKCALLVDGKTMSPASGIVKLAEDKPDEVEHLFRNVLFSNDNGDIALRQRNMEQFLSEIELLRQEEYPRNWKFKQDNHSVTCYMALYAPEQNYIYRHSSVNTFSRYVEFGPDIGVGSRFSLENYYSLCDHVVKALREHGDLLNMHFDFVSNVGDCYRDDSLHIMAFDLIYCARCYGYYTGIPYNPVVRVGKKFRLSIEDEVAMREEKISSLKQEILEYEEMFYDEYEDLSLINVEVHTPAYGKGIITHHEGVYITVDYEDHPKPVKYEINRKFTNRPSFENDTEIIEILYKYADDLQMLNTLNKKLSILERRVKNHETKNRK